jgi:hypothetical protein
MRKFMRTQPRLICNVVSDVLGVLSRNKGVVKQVVIKIFCCVFEVKLNQLNPVAKSIEGYFNALCNRNPLIIIGCKDSEWLDLFEKSIIIHKIFDSETGDLLVIHFCDIEDCLLVEF